MQQEGAAVILGKCRPASDTTIKSGFRFTIPSSEGEPAKGDAEFRLPR